jgi:molybdopterin molybdotransferase
VGDADYTKDVLAELGNIYFWKVAMKPGKPFAFGKLGECWFFGLPGNPVSAVVTYHQLVLPSLRYLSGEIFNLTPVLNAIAKHKFSKHAGRADYQRGILTNENDTNYVSSTGAQGSGVLTSMAKANCYIVLEQERGAVDKDEKVNVLLFDKFIN